jgi:glycosyltransferase involved in cell wall biosynthesis
MKILFITSSFYPNIGGVEKSVFYTARELSKRGNHISIVTLNPDNLAEKEQFNEGFEVYRIPRSTIPYTGMLSKWKWFLFHLGLIKKADIIHFHDFDVFINWFFPYRFIFFKKRYYITFHGYEGYPLKYKHVFLRKVSEFFTHGNICVGEFIKRWYRTKPDEIFYAAVDTKYITTTSKTGNNILFFGRLEKDTDILNYLKALQLFYTKTGSKIPLHILGDGSLSKEIKTFLENNNMPHKLLGSQKEPETFIKNSHLVLTSSYLSIVESLAHGKLVIAFYSNNLKREYLKSFPNSDAVMCITEDINEVANIIEKFIKKPLFYKDKINSGLILAKELTWSKVANKYLSLYNKEKANER